MFLIFDINFERAMLSADSALRFVMPIMQGPALDWSGPWAGSSLGPGRGRLGRTDEPHDDHLVFGALGASESSEPRRT
jgi:hypothetical protein